MCQRFLYNQKRNSLTNLYEMNSRIISLAVVLAFFIHEHEYVPGGFSSRPNQGVVINYPLLRNGIPASHQYVQYFIFNRRHAFASICKKSPGSKETSAIFSCL